MEQIKMPYTIFIEKIESLKYKEERNHFKEWENLLSQDKSLWEKWILRSLIQDKYSENTEYLLINIMGKKTGAQFFQDTINKIKKKHEKTHSPVLFTLLLNSDFLDISEKEKILNENKYNITEKHWKYFFYTLTYEGSKLLPIIKKDYNFKKYKNDPYFNRAYFNIENYVISEDDNINNEKLHVLYAKKQYDAFYGLLALGLSPTVNVINEKMNFMEKLIKQKKWAFLLKILSINDKNDHKIYFKNEAVFLIKSSYGKGINRDILHKLIKNTTYPNLINKNEDNLASATVIMEYIYNSSLSYHKKNVDLILNTLSAQEIKENFAPFNIRKDLPLLIALKESDEYKLSTKSEAKMNLALAMIEKDILNKVFSEQEADNNNLPSSNKKRL